MRHATSTRALNDPRYGLGRQPTVDLSCLGCSKILRRSKRYRVAGALCLSCNRAVMDAYEAKIRAEGIEPSVMPGSAWLPAWNRLSIAVHDGDRAFLAPYLP
jgi:hypothetical protein